MTIITPAGHHLMLTTLEDGALLRLYDPETAVTFVTALSPAQARELARELVAAVPAERRAHPRMEVGAAIPLWDLPAGGG